MRDWFGEMYKKHEKLGDFEYLEGKGKRLSRDVLEGDVLDRTIKSANFVPEWVQKRKDILVEMKNVIELRPHLDDQELEEKIDQVNALVRKYNRKCPPVMQRGLVSEKNLEDRYKSWQ
ncbi:DnaJ family domain-containing protein [Alteribacter populi]|uniref:DnaJ family domain-containing protein n=1 Tax=Alteribacter populi TaxID=2011011 RepID=UPI000BBA597E|nr:DnaJ family domain-containing protein [Alteribacter populi]